MLDLEITWILNCFSANKSFSNCFNGISNIQLLMNNAVLPYAGTIFKYVGLSLEVRQVNICVIPGKKDWVGALMSICKEYCK